MSKKKVSGLAFAMASLLMLSAGGAHAAGTYRCLPLKDSSTMPGESVAAPNALNNRQQVVGFGSAPHDFGSRPGSVMWGKDRQAVHLKDPDSVHSDAFDINDAGQAVGTLWDLVSGTARPVTWVDGQQINLRPLMSGGTGGATGINNRGKIVGASDKKLPSGAIVDRATLWFGGKAKDLGALIAGGSSQAYAINDDGVVVGMASAVGGGMVPVRWVDGQISALGFPTGTIAMPVDVNRSGVIVGRVFYGDGLPHAYAWQGDAVIEMGSLAGYPRSAAASINADGVAVGYGMTADHHGVALMWTTLQGQPVDLNTLVNAGGCVDAFGEQRQLTSAEGINDKGMIVATAEANVGGNPRQFAFILKPATP